jgi:hypothetical protein
MGNLISNLKPSLSTSTTRSEKEMAAEKPAFKQYSQAQSTFKPPLIANENAYLGDVYSR